MNNKNIDYQTTQKDWDDFFAGGYDFKDAFSPVDSYAKRVHMACEFSGWEVNETDQRLDESTEEEIFPTSRYEFDR